jgi:cell division protein FtsI (penicillin-binding protein 3)
MHAPHLDPHPLGSAPPGPGTHEPQASAGRSSQQIWRVWLVVIGFGLLASLVVVRLLHHQIVSWLAQSTPTVLADTELPRGLIVDRRGELLAADRFYYQVVADPSILRTEEQRLAVANKLQELIGLPAAETSAKLFEAADRRYVELAKRISLEAGNRLMTYKAEDEAENVISILQSVAVLPAPERYYPQGELAGHVLGFVQSSRKGSYGVEQYYDAYLNPSSGVGLRTKSAAPLTVLPEAVRRYLPSMGGKDLVLTLDTGIQWILEDELRRALSRYKAQSGSILVMDPATGAILGQANFPTYDPNRFSEQTDYSRFIDPATSLLYEPGSIFKIVTMAAALDAGVITPSTVYTDNGSITVGSRIIFNSNRIGYGQVSATDALARSLNVVTAQIAEQLGRTTFYDYVELFGFTEPTEVDLAGEVSGLVKMPGNPDWSLSDLGTNSFGQGLAITPMEMLNATAAIANGGRLLRPYIVQARVAGDRVLVTEPTSVRQVIQPETAQMLVEMMVQTVRTGNEAAGVAGYRIAGKSGTAQIPGEGGYLKDATIVSFVGFAPADDPQFVVLVKLDRPDPNISLWATHTAAPVFGQVARRLFDYLGIPPDEIRLGPERLAEIEAESAKLLGVTVD